MSYSTVTRAQLGQGLVSILSPVNRKQVCLQIFLFVCFVKYTEQSIFQGKDFKYLYGSRFRLFGVFCFVLQKVNERNGNFQIWTCLSGDKKANKLFFKIKYSAYNAIPQVIRLLFFFISFVVLLFI